MKQMEIAFKGDKNYLSLIDRLGNEHPCNIYTKIKKKFNLTTDNKLTLLLTLWVFDKIIMAVLIVVLK
jgi:uncharacterized protein YrzB (UPF0473 family)